ncbi:hypothetical protein SUGI_0492950 [Cryptomeria japonica]|nr:hypothetical protein SUGI_0492950 [Cryptomeria japonica]
MPYWAFGNELIFSCTVIHLELLSSTIPMTYNCNALLGFWHETQDLARVHTTNAEKKRWKVLYDLLTRSLLVALEARHISKTAKLFNQSGIAIKHNSHVEVIGSSPLDVVAVAMPYWASDMFGLIFFWIPCFGSSWFVSIRCSSTVH